VLRIARHKFAQVTAACALGSDRVDDLRPGIFERDLRRQTTDRSCAEPAELLLSPRDDPYRLTLLEAFSTTTSSPAALATNKAARRHQVH
jgi:hypothetical protein